jgi:hypothetical protein
MKALRDRLKEKVIEKALNYRNWVSENWVSYTLLKNAFFLLLFPLAYLLGSIPAIVGSFSTLLFLLMVVYSFIIFASFFLDSKRISVAEKRPADFIRAERVERLVAILFYALPLLWLTLLAVFAYRGRIGIPEEIVPFFQTFLTAFILAWAGLFISLEMSILESSKLVYLVKKKLRLRDKRGLLEFYPSENARARARFVVISNFLSSNPDKNAIGSKFRLFYQGVKIYNDHLKDDFGFVLREPKRFYCQAKLAAYSKDNVGNIRDGLESLTELMKDENTEPFEIMKSLKEMLNEPASFKEVCEDIDADPERIRKWFSVHSDSIIGIAGIILAGVELLFFSLVLR